MPRYVITERAGRFVAGQTNTGVGTTLELTERAAQHEIRLGTLVPEDGVAPPLEQPAPVPAPMPEPPVAAVPGDTDEDDAARARKPRRNRKAD